MNVLIAEDERPQREALEAMLREVWPEATVCASCVDGLDALEAFERERPAVAFLDLRMPGVGGLEVAQAMSHDAQTVFVTAFDDAAVRAFEQGAVDYVLKPIRRERLATTVARLKERLSHRRGADFDAVLGRLRAELSRTPKTPALKWVTASRGATVKLYAIDEVLAFQAQDKYTMVLTASDEAVIRTSLRELMAGLDSELFWQIHRSVIVRATAIEQVTRDELNKHWLRLKGRPGVLPVSSAFHKRLKGM